MGPRTSLVAASAVMLASLAVQIAAQGAAQPQPPAQGAPAAPAGQGPPGQPGRGRAQATFPAQQRPPGDPAMIARGQQIYAATCRACHGPDLRGGDMRCTGRACAGQRCSDRFRRTRDRRNRPASANLQQPRDTAPRCRRGPRNRPRRAPFGIGHDCAPWLISLIRHADQVDSRGKFMA